MNPATRKIIYAIAGIVGAAGLAVGVIPEDQLSGFTEQVTSVITSVVAIVGGLLALAHTPKQGGGNTGIEPPIQLPDGVLDGAVSRQTYHDAPAVDGPGHDVAPHVAAPSRHSLREGEAR